MIRTPHVQKNNLQVGASSTTALVDSILHDAHSMKASDIHIDPQGIDVTVRFRIDGVLQSYSSFSISSLSSVISRIKVLAGLRVDEHQHAQDGRFSFSHDDEFVHVRVSICPTYHGENAVLRLLLDRLEEITLSGLGFSPKDEQAIRKSLTRHSGMILVTGPTGSGKTTTLYSLMKLLHTRESSLVTIEDPIEYGLPGVKQIQVNQRNGLSFASGLRAILRQDPNIIMIGEIRDQETASIAVNSALTGHLVLSTLHTSDAATALPRLLDMKVEPFLAASTISLSIGERLVRKICEKCKERKEVNSAEFAHFLNTFSSIESGNTAIFKGAGCEACSFTGYLGRTIIAEVLVVTPHIRELVLSKAPAADIRALAIREGMSTMYQDGIQKVFSGQTTFEEVLRVVHE